MTYKKKKKKSRTLERHNHPIFRSLKFPTIHWIQKVSSRNMLSIWLFMTAGWTELLPQRDDKRFWSLTRELGSIHEVQVRQWRPPQSSGSAERFAGWQSCFSTYNAKSSLIIRSKKNDQELKEEGVHWGCYRVQHVIISAFV